MNKKTIWLGSAFVLILVAWLLWNPFSPDEQAASGLASKPKSARTASPDDASAQERTARRKTSERMLPEGSITTHQPEQLKDFVLTECKGHQVSLRTALKLIDEAYQDACYFSLEKPLKLTYEIDGESDNLLTFSLKGKSWLSAVKYVAALAGMEAKLEGEKVVLTPLEGADEVKESRVFPFGGMLEMLEQTLLDQEGANAEEPADDLVKLMRQNGIISSAEVKVDVEKNTITIRGDAQERAALEAFAAIATISSPQINATTKLITTKSPIETSQNTLSPAKVQELMRHLSQQEGTELVTAPSIMSRAGEEAMIEVKQENGENWTGLELKYNTDYIGLKMSSANQTEVRNKDDGGGFQQAEAQFLVYGGDSQIKNIGTEAGSYTYQITTLQAISPTGIPLEMKDAIRKSAGPMFPPVAKAVLGQPGFVYSPFSNNIVDVNGIPSGTLLADPYFPAEEKKHFRAP